MHVKASKLEMASSVLWTLCHCVHQLAKKKPVMVSRDRRAKRMAACQKCSSLRHSDIRCMECGCFLKIKTRLTTATCPNGEW